LQTLKGQFPDLKNTDLVKKAGEIWKTMTAEQKKPYTDKYEEQMLAYKKELQEYVRSSRVCGRPEIRWNVQVRRMTTETADLGGKQRGDIFTAWAENLLASDTHVYQVLCVVETRVQVKYLAGLFFWTLFLDSFSGLIFSLVSHVCKYIDFSL
jgi:hypothetical protein